MADSVEQFLEQSDGGGVRDSEGAFTVDVARALEKLQAFQLANPGDYLLKVVQAAAALGAPEITFKVGLKAVKASFALNQLEAPVPESIAHSLAGRGEWESEAARHIGIALRAGIGAGFQKSIFRLGPDHFLSLSPGDAHCQGTRQATGEKVDIHFLRGGLLRSLRGLLFSQEHSILYERVRFASFGVKLDGRKVERGWPRTARAQGHWYEYQSLPYYLMEGYYAPGPSLPGFFPPAVDLKEHRSLDRAGHFNTGELTDSGGYYEFKHRWRLTAMPIPTMYRVFDESMGIVARTEYQPECGVIFCQPLKLTGRAELTFLLDGVSSVPVSVDLGCPGLLVVASAVGLNVDLTEFQIVQDEAYRTRVEAIRIAALRFIHDLNCYRRFYGMLHSAIKQNSSHAMSSNPSYSEDVRKGIQQRLPRQ